MIGLGILLAAICYCGKYLLDAAQKLRQENALFMAIPQSLLIQALLFPELRLRLKSAYWEAYVNGGVDYLGFASLANERYKNVLRGRRAESDTFTQKYYRQRAKDNR